MMAQYVSVGDVTVLILTSEDQRETVRAALEYFGKSKYRTRTRSMKIAMNILNEMREPEENDG